MSYASLGYLQASNAIAQLVAVPIIGSMSDKYGRKPMLIICVIGTFVSFVMLALADSVWMLFASRILDGILGGNISLAQAYVSDMTTAEERTRGMGLLGAAFGLGFIVGPAAGGMLAFIDYSWPSWIAAALCVLNLYCIIRFLPETRTEVSSAESPSISSFMPAVSTLKEIASSRKLSAALSLRLGHMIVFTTFEIWFGYLTSDRLGLNARQSSYLLTLYGIVYSMVQATAIRSLVHKFQETYLLAVVLHLLGISYALAYFCDSYWTFAAVLVPLGMLSGISNTLVSSLVSKQVSPERVGGALGVSASLGSLSRIIGPTMTSYMVQHFSLSSPPVLCTIITFSLVLFQSVLRAEGAPSPSENGAPKQLINENVH